MDDKPSFGAVDAHVTELLELALDAVIQARKLMSDQNSAFRNNVHGDGPGRNDSNNRFNLSLDDNLLPRIGKSGKVGAKILLRLLDEPDQYVLHSALAKAAALRSPTSDAIKVYICYLRNALRDSGYSPEMIETGRHSYRIRKRDVEILCAFLFDS